MAKSRPRSKCTESQTTYIEAKLAGKSNNAAAVEAGQRDAQKLSTSSTVREQLAAARRWLTDTTQIKRLDVIEGVIDGIEMARMQGDSGNVIKGWTEVGKILGHYAPEVKAMILTDDQSRIRSKFESLSDEELLAIQNGITVEGECSRVPQPTKRTKTQTQTH